MQRDSVLAWPQEGLAETAPAHPPIERFKNGARKTVLMLGDPVKRNTHWNADLKRSVPCFKPSACPFCSDPKFTRTTRLEGYAPVMVLNPKSKQWEQAVAVFTKGGLTKLAEIAPAQYRGWMIEVYKQQDQSGAVAPMSVRRLAPLPESFPELPPEFSAKAVMLRHWFPELEHAEPIQWIDPIKVERRARPISLVQPMEIDPEQAILLAQELKSRGLKSLAKHVSGSRAADVEVTSPSAASAAAPDPRPHPKPTPTPTPPQPEEDEPEPEPADETPIDEREVLKVAADPKNYGPREKLNRSIVPPAEKAIAAAESRLKDGSPPDDDAAGAALRRLVKRTKGGAA